MSLSLSSVGVATAVLETESSIELRESKTTNRILERLRFDTHYVSASISASIRINAIRQGSVPRLDQA